MAIRGLLLVSLFSCVACGSVDGEDAASVEQALLNGRDLAFHFPHDARIVQLGPPFLIWHAFNGASLTLPCLGGLGIGQVQVHYDYFNDGNQPVFDHANEVRWGTSITSPVLGLGPGGMQTLHVGPFSPPMGASTLTITLDVNKDVAEQLENNNKHTTAIFRPCL